LEWWQALLLAIIEGLTEFLPVSSTGHMILASSAMGIASDSYVKMFTVAIQFGAILSVVLLYYKRFLNLTDLRFYLHLFIAFLPAVFFGLLLKDWIDALLENPMVVAISLLLGGMVLVGIDRWFRQTATGSGTRTSPLKALVIGCFQVLAMVPGVSRSAATIIGGMSQGLNRTQAAEFSFFLAVPTMLGATVKSMWDLWQTEPDLFHAENLKLLALGNLVAFLVALMAIRGFIAFLTKRGFALFGWYRIVLGGVLLLLYAAGFQLEMVG